MILLPSCALVADGLTHAQPSKTCSWNARGHQESNHAIKESSGLDFHAYEVTSSLPSESIGSAWRPLNNAGETAAETKSGKPRLQEGFVY